MSNSFFHSLCAIAVFIFFGMFVSVITSDASEEACQESYQKGYDFGWSDGYSEAEQEYMEWKEEYEDENEFEKEETIYFLNDIKDNNILEDDLITLYFYIIEKDEDITQKEAEEALLSIEDNYELLNKMIDEKIEEIK